MNERLAIVGSGAIACGLAVTAAHEGPVLLIARSYESADRASKTVERSLQKLGADIDPQHVEVLTNTEALVEATFVVEAVIEHHEVKAELLSDISSVLADDALLGTTTSSLSVQRLAEASGRPDRFVGMHVFNPVPKMSLVELVFPPEASATTKGRAISLCESLGKTPVVVPDIPGFVVNRLLFPYLFNAVELLEETSIAPSDLDSCMQLGAGHPMGPLALLDLVGLDVSKAIGQEIGAAVPPMLQALIDEGALGRKAGKGFHDYERRNGAA